MVKTNIFDEIVRCLGALPYVIKAKKALHHVVHKKRCKALEIFLSKIYFFS